MKALLLSALLLGHCQVSTTNSVPSYSGRPGCTVTNANIIAHEFAKDGASHSTQLWAMKVASRESGCNFKAVNINNRTKDRSYCAFQLNARTGGPLGPGGYLYERGWYPAKVISSMQACADAASNLWKRCGRGPWTKPYGCRRPVS